MPTPAKTSQAELVKLARGLVEAAGPGALTLGALAERAGIKPPSLYKHFVDRAAVLKAVEIEVLYELEDVDAHGRPTKQSTAEGVKRTRKRTAAAPKDPVAGTPEEVEEGSSTKVDMAGA